MAIVDIVQRSEKWFPWRAEGITASMMPVIMALSPYQTPYQLWAELVGLKKPDDLSNNYHVQRGVIQEPEARDAVESEFGKPYMPVCVEADHNTLFRASLDGLYLSQAIAEVLEIKCPCEKIFNEIATLQGQAPTFQMYAAQVQWQLNCANANAGTLYFYLRGKRPIRTTIKRNQAFIDQAEKKALWFWNLVQTKTPPPLIEGRDNVVYDLPKIDDSWLPRVEQYREKSQRLNELKNKVKAISADLSQMDDYFTSQLPDDVKTFDKDGIRVTKVDRDGSVDYEALLAELATEMNIQIPNDMRNKHLKKGCSYFRITLNDKENTKPKIVSEEQPVELSAVEPKKLLDDVGITVEPKAKEPEVITETVKMEQPKPILVKPVPSRNFFEKSQSNVFF